MRKRRRQHRFTVRGHPIAKARPRFSGKHVYTPKRTLTAQASIAEAYDGPFFEGPVSVSCVFSKDRTVITITELEEDPSVLRGDTTNYLKTVEDALNGVAYEDDRQVQRVVGKKR